MPHRFERFDTKTDLMDEYSKLKKHVLKVKLKANNLCFIK